MADTKSSVILETTDTAGKKLQKTLTDINPDVGGATLRTFTQALNGLTTNTYVGTNRVDKTDLANAVEKNKVAITASFNNSGTNTGTITVTSIIVNGFVASDATSMILAVPSTADSAGNFALGKPTKNTANNSWTIAVTKPSAGQAFDVQIQLPETDTCKASNVVTVNIPLGIIL